MRFLCNGIIKGAKQLTLNESSQCVYAWTLYINYSCVLLIKLWNFVNISQFKLENRLLTEVCWKFCNVKNRCRINKKKERWNKMKYFCLVSIPFLNRIHSDLFIYITNICWFETSERCLCHGIAWFSSTKNFNNISEVAASKMSSVELGKLKCHFMMIKRRTNNCGQHESENL